MGDTAAAENWRQRCYKEEHEVLKDVARRKQYIETLGLSSIGTIVVPVNAGKKPKAPRHPGPPPSQRGIGAFPRGKPGPKSAADVSCTSSRKGPRSDASYPATPNYSSAGSQCSGVESAQILARLEKLEAKLHEERARREVAEQDLELLKGRLHQHVGGGPGE
eukprot:CAMPEP_0118926804 /NCGR_PEP_ID=MMETSP1169-20130426/4422_1 /TAXON_ID=36882 /ORGANISM="Pyramimonas obovata, Strain CCMP722" /LENGTH=162 /DNA_ID=CAMNT_0006868433 /DNA_START=76 /DNA_END=564 /DNA_ORIENTATION=-